MDPLPSLHRRGIIIGALLMIIGFLLPTGGEDTGTTTVTRNAQLDLQSQTRPQPDAQPMQTQLVTPSNDPGQSRQLNQSRFRMSSRRNRPQPLQNLNKRGNPPELSNSGAPIA